MNALKGITHIVANTEGAPFVNGEWMRNTFRAFTSDLLKHENYKTGCRKFARSY